MNSIKNALDQMSPSLSFVQDDYLRPVLVKACEQRKIKQTSQSFDYVTTAMMEIFALAIQTLINATMACAKIIAALPYTAYFYAIKKRPTYSPDQMVSEIRAHLFKAAATASLSPYLLYKTLTEPDAALQLTDNLGLTVPPKITSEKPKSTPSKTKTAKVTKSRTRGLRDAFYAYVYKPCRWCVTYPFVQAYEHAYLTASLATAVAIGFYLYQAPSPGSRNDEPDLDKDQSNNSTEKPQLTNSIPPTPTPPTPTHSITPTPTPPTPTHSITPTPTPSITPSTTSSPSLNKTSSSAPTPSLSSTPFQTTNTMISLLNQNNQNSLVVHGHTDENKENTEESSSFSFKGLFNFFSFLQGSQGNLVVSTNKGGSGVIGTTTGTPNNPQTPLEGGELVLGQKRGKNSEI